MQCLTGVDIQTRIQTIASRNGEVMVAVAYWGKGAAERTGLSRHQNPGSVRILCDLLSGACNPEEVNELRKIGFCVNTLDRLHAKVWVGGGDVIVGSANASQNGLPGEANEAANANVEAAVLSHDPQLVRQLTTWFELQWDASTKIKGKHLDRAREIWERRRRSGGRGFTSSLGKKIRNPGSLDRFHALRLLAYLDEGSSREAEDFVTENARRYYTDEEWQKFRELGEDPWYELPSDCPEWPHKPGIVFADFDRNKRDGPFTFRGFWQILDCPSIALKTTRITLLTKLPDFDGYELSRREREEISRRVGAYVEEQGCHTDAFGSYIDENFLEFADPERPALRQRLVAQVAEVAQELCRAQGFDPAITLHAIRACKENPEWLADYVRFVGGDPYGSGNRLKQQINQEFGRAIKAATQTDIQKDKHGRTIRREVEDEIIQSYTLLKR